MIKKVLSMLLVGATLFGVGCSYTKQKEVKEVKELKIASATVAAAQVMDKLNLNLVGIPTTKTVLPERYTGVQDIGQAHGPNFETIASLNPDLLVVDINFKDKVAAQADQYGVKTFYFDTSTFTNFKGSIGELGKITSREEEATKLVDDLNKSVDDVLAKAKKSDKKPKVAILFGTAESYMLATDKSYVGDLLNTIGVDNITDGMTGVDSAYLNFSMEQVVKLNPDYILRLSHGEVEESKKAFEKEFSTNPGWAAIKATKIGQVFDLNPAVFGVTANLSATKAIDELGNIIYGK